MLIAVDDHVDRKKWRDEVLKEIDEGEDCLVDCVTWYSLRVRLSLRRRPFLDLC